MLDEHRLAKDVAAVMFRGDAGNDLVAGEQNCGSQSVLMIRRVECVDEMVQCQTVVMAGGRIPIGTPTIGEGEVFGRD